MTGDLNPGSDEALKAGCECPVFDNGHGQGAFPYPDGCFWINQNCPLHGKPKQEKEK